MRMRGFVFPYADVQKTHTFPYLTVLFIAANVAIFFLSLGNFDATIMTWGFIPALMPSAHALVTLFTSMFLHGGFDHIFGNMWYLWIFGDNVEDHFGRLRFVALYLLSGLAASMLQYVTDTASTIPSVGASGAISGILGAYLIIYPRARVITGTGFYGAISLPAYVVIGLWFLLQLVFGAATFAGYTGSNIAFFAHIGGFLFGMAFAYISKRSKRR